MSALAAIGDVSVVPTLIGMIVADPSAQYAVGHFALGNLLGLPYDKSHDGAFWLQWWENNRQRLPASIRSASIPSVHFPN